jgi:hypothetical protein
VEVRQHVLQNRCVLDFVAIFLFFFRPHAIILLTTSFNFKKYYL